MSFAQRSYPVKVRRVNLVVAIIIIVIAVTVGTVIALVSLQQTVPSETFNGPVAVTSSTCNSATTPLTNFPDPAIASPGVVNMTCASGPAFSVTTAGSDTPTFALPTIQGATESLYIISHSSGCPSSTVPPTGQLLTSGTPMALALGSYNYCWGYSTIPIGGTTATSFTITWSS